MFGERIDYFLLRPLAHGRNRASEEELDRSYRESTFTPPEADACLQKVMSVYFPGCLVPDPNLSYLDIGCGMGRLSFGLVRAGAKDVVGIDITPRCIEGAKALAARWGLVEQPQFICADVLEWKPDRKYDVLFLLEAMEHIPQPDRFLAALPRLMKDDGVVLLTFGPWESPLADHLDWFFRVPIPWRGLLFSEKALMRLRREYFRPTDPAERLCEIVGGLNQMRYRQFVRYVRQAGFRFDYLSFNPQLRRIFKPLYFVSEGLTRLPVIGNYFKFVVMAVLKRADQPKQ